MDCNTSSNIPGLLESVRAIPGLAELLRLSKYNLEYFYPRRSFDVKLFYLAHLLRETAFRPKHKGFLGLGLMCLYARNDRYFGYLLN